MKQAAEQANTTISPISDAHQPVHAARATRTITGQLYRHRTSRGVTFRAAPPPEPVRRPARVARMLALAHRLDAAIERGKHKSQAALARSAGLTRARITQLLDLTLLAPDIQAEVLELQAVDGVEPMSVRALQAITRAEVWAEQRDMWRRVHEEAMLDDASANARRRGGGRHLLRAADTMSPRKPRDLGNQG